MRFLIAGLGSIGRRHLRNLLALGEKDIILYRKYQSTLSEDEIAGFEETNDLRTALGRQPNAVIVSTPTSLHLDTAIPAAEAGCHLLLEKPISNTMERIDDLRAAVKYGNGQVLVGFQFRFHPTIRTAAEIINDGTIGKPLFIRAHWGEYLPSWHPWEDYRLSYAARNDLGGGVLLTLCHPIDYVRYLFGEIKSVHAIIDSIGDLEINAEDMAEISLRFENGAMGTIHLDYLQQPPTHKIEIIGSNGTILWNGQTGCLKLYSGRSNNWQTFEPPNGFERNWMFLEEMRHFIAVIRQEIKPICNLDDGIRVMEIVCAARLASKDGQLRDVIG